MEEDEANDIAEEIPRLYEFLAGAPRPEQTTDYSPRPSLSGLRRREPAMEQDDLTDLYTEDECYSEELHRLLRL
jgi:hypothetical protein